MSVPVREWYDFGPFRLNPSEHVLLREGRPVALPPKAVDLLVILVMRAGHVVTKDELLKEVWTDTYVEEANVSYTVSVLRKGLGGREGEPQEYIETVPKRGYRFIAEVGVHSDDATEPPASASAQPVWRRFQTWHIGVAALVALVLAAWGARILWTQAAAEVGVMRPRSVAVLPFKPLVAGEGDEPLQFGMTEAVIGRLSRIASLRVTPLAAVRRFDALDQDPLDAARALGVDAVLEGYFQRRDGRVHVRSRLLRASDGTALATNEWQEPFTDIIDVQTRLAEGVAAGLALTLTDAERAGVRRAETTNAAALDHYLVGRYHLDVRDIARMVEAEREFREAIRLDPQFALAHAGLALALVSRASLRGARAGDAAPAARAAAQRALHLDESLALAHVARAMVFWLFDFDPRSAQPDLLRAMELDDEEPWVLTELASFLSDRGAFDEALELSRRLLQLAPTSPRANMSRAMLLYEARRYDECLVLSRKALSLDPRFAAAYGWLAYCLEQLGKRDEAVEAFEQGRTLRGDGDVAATLNRLYKAQGWEAYWREWLNLAARGQSSGPLRGPIYVARAHVRLGELGEALTALEQAYEDRDLGTTTFIIGPEWDRLRSEPRFQALRLRVGLSDDVSAELAAARAAWRNRPR